MYDSPSNLFVAKFLGTPPINVFEGEIRGEKLVLAGQAVLDAPGVSDRKVFAGIRPEGFIPSSSAPFACGLDRVEVLGRDTSMVCTHPACQAGTLRAIVQSEQEVSPANGTVRFGLRPEKVFLFDWESEKRISLAADPHAKA